MKELIYQVDTRLFNLLHSKLGYKYGPSDSVGFQKETYLPESHSTFPINNQFNASLNGHKKDFLVHASHSFPNSFTHHAEN